MVTGDGSPGVTRRSTEPHDATERKQAEEALPESETILLRLLESASEAVVIVDGDGRIVLVNARSEEMFGYSRDELLDQPVEILMPALFRKAHDDHRAGYVAHPRVRPMGPGLDLVGRRKDGTEFPIEIGLSFIETDGAGLTMSIITNITERKRAEEALRESEERLRILFEYAPDGYYLLDSQGTFIDGNKAAQEITGYTREELIGKKFQETGLLSPDQLPQAIATLTKNVAGQPSGPDEFVLNRKDGTRLPVEIQTFQVEIGGEPVILGIARDISERRQAEEALRKSEERFRSTFEHASIGMVLVDADGGILQVNQSMCEMLGYSQEELTSSTWQAITHPDDLDIGLDLMRRTLAGEMDSNQIEKRYLHKLGHSVWVQLSFSLVRGDDGRPLYFIAQIQDISERKRAEEQLQVARERLEGRVERQLQRRNPYGLTFREVTVLHLVAAGKSDKETGIDLGISPLTARKHISNILTKMDAASRTEAVARGLREGLLD